MQKALILKVTAIAVVFAVLMIPLGMIGGIVRERADRQQEVVRQISLSQSGPQTFAGPVLTLPYVEEYEATVRGEHGESRVERQRVEHVLRIFPSRLSIDGNAAVETKTRGLFKARVFAWTAKLEGEFAVGETAVARDRPDSTLHWLEPRLVLGISDPRGLMDAPSLVWNDQPLGFERGAESLEGNGVQARLPAINPNLPRRVAFAIGLGLRGTERLSIVPLADNNRVSLASPWPHPSFGGQFLPGAESQQVGPAGFRALWVVSNLATGAQGQLAAAWQGGQHNGCRDFGCADQLEVRFVDPIDIYSLSDRAVKYGFLFIGFTFGCFLLLEVSRRLPLHPAQYVLVGLALATFFLLLLGLSEHLPFVAAYAVATVACVGLIGHYLAAALGGRLRGAGFAAALATLYGALYGLLISEDNALMLGSLLVFLSLAAAMTATRSIDWYALPETNLRAPRKEAPAVPRS